MIILTLKESFHQKLEASVPKEQDFFFFKWMTDGILELMEKRRKNENNHTLYKEIS